MRRSALSVFFERVIVVTLPLAVPACGGNNGTTPPVVAPDLAVAIEADMLEAPSDMVDTGAFDLSNSDLDSCELQHPVHTANLPAAGYPDGGFGGVLCINNYSPCNDVCGTGYTQCCHPVPSDGGAYLVNCVYSCGPSGRRPAGLAAAEVHDGCAVGRYFASMAHLEAASVHAFRVMARELSAHGAPRSLVAAARRAARDEIRHARATRTMARAHGGTPAPVRVTPPAARSLEAMATENAVEGCVRETFGALLASWQARAAGDATVRAMMKDIAVDETRHAELAWALDRWSATRLDRAARRRIQDARRAAVEALGAELKDAPAPELVAEVGLPDAARAQALFTATARGLWS